MYVYFFIVLYQFQSSYLIFLFVLKNIFQKEHFKKFRFILFIYLFFIEKTSKTKSSKRFGYSIEQ